MIQYTFKFTDGQSIDFNVDFTSPPPPVSAASTPAFWTKLDYCQCPRCPLAAADHSHCPAALALEQVVARFASSTSFEEVDVEVRSTERTVVKKTDTQSALRSLMGLKLANCGCPILARLRGPARMHLPFANFEETLFRMVGSYLIKQYTVASHGGTPDWKLTGLNQLYTELQTVNIWLKRRFDALNQKDANLNAVIAFLTFSSRISLSIEEQLSELTPFMIDSDAPAPADATPAGAPVGNPPTVTSAATPDATTPLPPAALATPAPRIRMKRRE